MVVKQNNDTIRIEVYKKGTLKNTFIGSADLHIYTDIVKKLFPCNMYFNIVNKNQIVATACLSFHYINLECIKKEDQIYTSLFIETIIAVQKNHSRNNEMIEKLINEGKEHFDAIKETDVSSSRSTRTFRCAMIRQGVAEGTHSHIASHHISPLHIAAPPLSYLQEHFLPGNRRQNSTLLQKLERLPPAQQFLHQAILQQVLFLHALL